MANDRLSSYLFVTFWGGYQLKAQKFFTCTPAIVVLPLILWLLTACGAAPRASAPSAAVAQPTEVTAASAPPATDTPAPQATATSTAAPVAVATKPPTAVLMDWANTAGIEGDYYVLGNPAAPIRLVDYSDFL
jgi:hypothetical protein